MVWSQVDQRALLACVAREGYHSIAGFWELRPYMNIRHYFLPIVLACAHVASNHSPLKDLGKKDYSGFDQSQRPERCVDDHRKHVMSWKHAHTLAKRKEIETKFGVRYIELLRLPYFDTIFRCSSYA